MTNITNSNNFVTSTNAGISIIKSTATTSTANCAIIYRTKFVTKADNIITNTTATAIALMNSDTKGR